MKKTNTNYNAEGITLVALVVTIIILLILAGITITFALGNNGVIEKAQYASNMYANATKNEKKTMDEFVDTIEEKTGKILNIRDKDGNRIAVSEISNYYGSDVIYNNQNYQLFYFDRLGKYGDAGRIYLQYKSPVGIDALSNHYETIGLDNVNSLAYKLNPDWAKIIGNTLTTKELDEVDEKLKGLAYLCNSERWNNTYVASGDEDKGVYAVGGASVEMYCDSYTSRLKTEFSAKAFNEDGTIGYRLKPGNSASSARTNDEGYGHYTINGLLSTEYGEMYAMSNNNSTWLASPIGSTTNRLCCIRMQYLHIGNALLSESITVRPLVSIPSNVQIKLES